MKKWWEFSIGEITFLAKIAYSTIRKNGVGQVKRCQMFCFNFSDHFSISNILPKDNSKVSFTQKLTVSKKFDNFAKITRQL